MDSTLMIGVLPLGWLLDLLWGDPTALPHPVVYFGKWIALNEHYLNRGKFRLLRGAVFAVLSIALVGGLSWWLLESLHHRLPLVGMGIQTILVFFCLAGHTLRREVCMVFEAVDRDIQAGRRQVARIVGRETNTLSAQEIRTAALETLAENLSDGVVAPLFWYGLLGVPGMLMYKMINTMDSMIGYRDTRYKEFGCWAARIDDMANYLPARLTAALMMVVGWIVLQCTRKETDTLHSFARLVRFVLRYGRKHASPNSGWPEAALAGLLGCRFGGTHQYFGQAVYKPYIGDQQRELTGGDLQTAIRICLWTEVLFLPAALLLWVVAGSRC